MLVYGARVIILARCLVVSRRMCAVTILTHVGGARVTVVFAGLTVVIVLASIQLIA